MILELKDIKLSFVGGHGEALNLLNGVNLGIEKGKVTALVGGNGAGKTTLFNIISGFQKGFSGDVLFEGNNLNRLSPSRISLMGVGRLFQGGQLLEGLTLMENMKLASDNTIGEIPFSSLFALKRLKETEKEKEQLAKDIIARVFGSECKYLQMLNSDVASFSYGEQRILALALLLMGNDRMLLLDEPTSGVNPRYIDTIEKIIKEMAEAEGLTVLVIEHNMHFVRRIADTCAYLDDGVIAKVGPTAEVLDDINVRNSYLGL